MPLLRVGASHPLTRSPGSAVRACVGSAALVGGFHLRGCKRGVLLVWSGGCGGPNCPNAAGQVCHPAVPCSEAPLLVCEPFTAPASPTQQSPNTRRTFAVVSGANAKRPSEARPTPQAPTTKNYLGVGTPGRRCCLQDLFLARVRPGSHPQLPCAARPEYASRCLTEAHLGSSPGATAGDLGRILPRVAPSSQPRAGPKPLLHARIGQIFFRGGCESSVAPLTGR
jgi:hypothetical protein